MGSSSQQFCVRWNSYQSNLQNAFPKLLANENFVDVTIACEGQMVKCHKVVLSACSTYFETLLSDNPCQHPIIFMKDMRFWEVRALVDFMYRGEVNVTQEELNSLLRAAESLQIRGLYGNEQQKVAAAVTKATELSKKDDDSNLDTIPIVSVNMTTEEKSSPNASQPDACHEQMVKLEEDISLMEEQSVSDLDDGSHDDYATSQDFESFVGDQHYPPPRGTPQAGPSGMTMTPTTMTPCMNTNTMDDGAELLESTWEEDADACEIKFSRSVAWSEDNKGNRLAIYPHHQLQVQHSMAGPMAQSEEDLTNSPNKRIRRSEEELSEAANLISRGLTFQAVSDKYNIPISTIRFYMARKGILPRRKRGRVNRYDEILRSQNFQQNGPPAIQ
ncbi:protein bric-a-brac 2-like isoform X2 [Neocloeon triangulifer]|uniref:protein bric-a-brac 2-like isoform X2 n=1 Tax=Neocloeon triangulifer TaxID=2078957 RepID=UPI00286F13EC|nr:protein bric-a-brac 2-like isoform X2 [Neocloeon triangulifer]